jgi:hypothetical protein
MITPGSPVALRASDAEREAVAARLRAAAAEGRLTLTEADERQAAAYAAHTRDELVPLTADLPEPRPDRTARGRARTPGPMTAEARRRFALHAGVVAVLAAFLVTGWALGPAPFFWPLWPLFWLGLSLVVHHRRARRRPAGAEGP